MSNAKTNCLCGAVTITVKEVDPKFTVCHCQSCRTWGEGHSLRLNAELT